MNNLGSVSNQPSSNLSGVRAASGQVTTQTSAPNESLEAFILRVASEAGDIQKNLLFGIAKQVDENNQNLKQLGTANSDLSALLALFPKDGDDKTIVSINNMNDNEQKILKKAVSDVFANPNAALPELKGDSDGATDKMNKYLAMVQSGLRSGVIKPSDQDKYKGLSPTKAELTALGQAIKAQTDSLSNISSKLQLAVNQYQSNKNNIEQFVAQLQSAFSNAIRNTISKMT